MGSRLNEWEQAETAGQGDSRGWKGKKKTVAQWAHRKDSPLTTMQAGNLRLQQIGCTNPAEWGRGESSPLSHNTAPAWATGHNQA